MTPPAPPPALWQEQLQLGWTRVGRWGKARAGANEAPKETGEKQKGKTQWQRQRGQGEQERTEPAGSLGWMVGSWLAARHCLEG